MVKPLSKQTRRKGVRFHHEQHSLPKQHLELFAGFALFLCSFLCLLFLFLGILEHSLGRISHKPLGFPNFGVA